MASVEENILRLGGLRAIRNTWLPMPEEEIAELERSIGARLPDGYHRFLATHGNCGFANFIDFTTLTPVRPWISDKTTRWHFGLFYGSKASTYSIAWSIDTLRDRMPETLIPIGEDGMGNQICLGIAGPERGKIYFWDHEDEWDEDEYLMQGKPVPPDLKFRNVHLIANSFEEFLDQMYVNEDV